MKSTAYNITNAEQNYIIILSTLGDEFDVETIEGENFRPMLDTDAARQALEYLKELLQFSHPESMKCNWDRRIRIFTQGQAAMSYGWSIRASAFLNWRI